MPDVPTPINTSPPLLLTSTDFQVSPDKKAVLSAEECHPDTPSIHSHTHRPPAGLPQFFQQCPVKEGKNNPQLPFLTSNQKPESCSIENWIFWGLTVTDTARPDSYLAGMVDLFCPLPSHGIPPALWPDPAGSEGLVD